MRTVNTPENVIKSGSGLYASPSMSMALASVNRGGRTISV